MQKSYSLDTNVLLEREDSVEVLRNGNENQINIPITVINELDGLLKNNKKRHNVIKVVKNILENKENINFTGNSDEIINNDDKILKTVQDNDILVTNDLILQLKAHICGIESEEFKASLPFQSESEKYTGFINWYGGDKFINNCFYFKDGKIFFNEQGKEKCLDFNHEAWKVEPKDIYQNAALELLTNKNIPLVSLQSKAGTGKSFLSLASALYMTFQQKVYDKVVIVKSASESTESLGYLPGDVNEKMQPHWRPLYKLLLKLHDIRECNKIWEDPNNSKSDFNPRHLEFIPINFLRSDNIDNSFVIISEAQNITRDEMRTILTRMGENCKVVIEGDTSQVDNPACNPENNGLNWVVKLFKNDKRYGHLKMQCKRTRGEICDMVTSYGL